MTAAPEMAAYNVTKAGVLTLSETLHVELRQYGVTVVSYTWAMLLAPWSAA